MDKKTLVEMYEKVLKGGESAKLPRGFWSAPDAKENGLTLLRHVVKNIEELSDEEIRRKVKRDFIVKYKLLSLYRYHYGSSIVKLWQDAFPDMEYKCLNCGKLMEPTVRLFCSDACKWKVVKIRERTTKRQEGICFFCDNKALPGRSYCIDHKALYSKTYANLVNIENKKDLVKKLKLFSEKAKKKVYQQPTGIIGNAYVAFLSQMFGVTKEQFVVSNGDGTYHINKSLMENMLKAIEHESPESIKGFKFHEEND